MCSSYKYVTFNFQLGQQMQQLQQMQMIQNIRFGLGGFSNPLGGSYFPDQGNHGHGDHLKHGDDFNKPQKAMVRNASTGSTAFVWGKRINIILDLVI